MLKFKVVVEIPKYETLVEAEDKNQALEIAEERFCQEIGFTEGILQVQEA